MRVPTSVCAAFVIAVFLGSSLHADDSSPEGVLIKSVVPNSAAAKIGLRSGDRILTIDDEPVDDAFSMAVAISTHQAGTPLKLGVLRTGKLIALAGQVGRTQTVARSAAAATLKTSSPPLYLSTPGPGSVARPIDD